MIPQELKDIPQWVLHKAKIPLNPVTLAPASSTDPATWTGYDMAHMRFLDSPDVDGLGFVFTGQKFIGIDLDHVVENGVINDFAKEIIRKCNSYTEFSPSGTGIHIFLKGHLERAYKRAPLEVYQTGRYFTMTGKAVLPLRPIREVDFDSLGIIPKQESLVKPANWISERLGNVKNGERNNAFTEVAGSLRARGYSVDDMFAMLQPHAEKVQFGTDELRSVCESVGRYQPNAQGAEDDSADSIEEFLKDEIAVDWLCKPFFAKGSIHFVAGLPEALKTWALIDLAVEAAKGGGMWLGKFPVNKAKVLFVDQERFKGETQRRFRSVISEKKILPKEISKALHVRCGSSTKLDIDRSYEAFRSTLEKIRPDVVIVDSFATFHTKEESNRMEIQQVLERVKKLRAEFGCSFIFVHHETKSVFQSRKDGKETTYLDMAGNIAIPAAAEIVINVVKHDDSSSFIHHTKSTLASKHPPFLTKISDADGGVRIEAV